MTFADRLWATISRFAQFMGDLFLNLAEFLAKPLAYLLYFLEGVFYFFEQLFFVAVKLIILFGMLFQFFFAIVAGFFRTIYQFVTFSPSASVKPSFPSSSGRGLQFLVDMLEPIGFLTIAPAVGICLLWIFFIYMIIGLVGGEKA